MLNLQAMSLFQRIFNLCFLWLWALCHPLFVHLPFLHYLLTSFKKKKNVIFLQLSQDLDYLYVDELGMMAMCSLVTDQILPSKRGTWWCVTFVCSVYDGWEKWCVRGQILKWKSMGFVWCEKASLMSSYYKNKHFYEITGTNVNKFPLFAL